MFLNPWVQRRSRYPGARLTSSLQNASTTSMSSMPSTHKTGEPLNSFFLSFFFNLSLRFSIVDLKYLTIMCFQMLTKILISFS
jgi:hypothetical protein